MLRLEIDSDSDGVRLKELIDEDGEELLLSLELSEIVASSQLLDSRGTIDERDAEETGVELLLEDIVEVRSGCVDEGDEDNDDGRDEPVDAEINVDPEEVDVTEAGELVGVVEPVNVETGLVELSEKVLKAVKLDKDEEEIDVMEETFVSLARFTNCCGGDCTNSRDS